MQGSTADALRASLRAARPDIGQLAARSGLNAVRPGAEVARIKVSEPRPVPAAIQEFGSAVVDKVGARNPLLAENKIVPPEPERDVLLPPPSEMTQSFDSVPSVQNASTKKKVRQNKNLSIQEETLEVVNFLNLINLRIIP